MRTQFRRQNINGERWLGVLDAVAKASKWAPRRIASSRQTGRIRTGRGIALGTHLSSYGAAVADIEVDTETGVVVAKHMFGSIDPGQVINPGIVERQIEAQMCVAASRMLKEEVTFSKTNVTSLDWGHMPAPAVRRSPDVTAVVVNRPSVPASGAGEKRSRPARPPSRTRSSTRPVCGCIRFRFTPARVLAALRSAAAKTQNRLSDQGSGSGIRDRGSGIRDQGSRTMMANDVTRRDLLKRAGMLGGAAIAAQLIPPSVARALAQQPAAAADPLAAMRAQMAATPIQQTRLTNLIVMFSGPGGSVVVRNGEEGKVVVDTFVQGAFAGLKQRLDAIGNAPIVATINTHWHFDHADNNESFRKTGSKLIAHENTKRRLAQAHDLLGMKFRPAPAAAMPTQTFTQTDHVVFELTGTEEYIDLGYIQPAHTDTDLYVYVRHR